MPLSKRKKEADVVISKKYFDFEMSRKEKTGGRVNKMQVIKHNCLTARTVQKYNGIDIGKFIMA